MKKILNKILIGFLVALISFFVAIAIVALSSRLVQMLPF